MSTVASLQTLLRAEGINAHSFRHTHATKMIEAGAPLKGVAGRLGHKSISITDSVYTHATLEMQKASLEAFENADKLQTKREK